MTAVLHAHKQRASERTCTLKVQKKRLLALQLTGALHDSKEHVNVGAGCGEMIERCLDLVILQSQTRDTESAGSLQLGLGCFCCDFALLADRSLYHREQSLFQTALQPWSVADSQVNRPRNKTRALEIPGSTAELQHPQRLMRNCLQGHQRSAWISYW